MAELLFALAVAGLIHLPGVQDASPLRTVTTAAMPTTTTSPPMGTNSPVHMASATARRCQSAHGHGQPPAHGVGGDAQVDIVETPGVYTFLLDVPDLSKFDIQKIISSVIAGGNHGGSGWR